MTGSNSLACKLTLKSAIFVKLLSEYAFKKKGSNLKPISFFFLMERR